MQIALNNIIPIGVRYILLSVTGFSLMTACVKLVSTHGIPVLEIVAARSAVSLVISYLMVKRKNLPIWGKNPPLLFVRGTVGALTLVSIYFAITTMPLAEATVLQYLYPIFTALLAMLFLKEKVQASTLICICLSLTGLVLMVQPSFLFATASTLPLLSVGAAVMGALGSAIAYILVKRLSETEDSSVIIFYFPLISLPLSMVLLGRDFVMPETDALLLLLLVGIFTQVGQVGITKGLETLTANKAATYSYIHVLLSAFLGWLLFSEVPSLWSWLGGSLIMIGVLINVLGKH